MWLWVVVGRTVRSWGYAERAEDLLVTQGVLRRQLVVVPYGRMQFVDVSAGPLDRRFGLATVQLHTAAAATDAAIPGLGPDEAARLRDRLHFQSGRRTEQEYEVGTQLGHLAHQFAAQAGHFAAHFGQSAAHFG